MMMYSREVPDSNFSNSCGKLLFKSLMKLFDRDNHSHQVSVFRTQHNTLQIDFQHQKFDN